MDNDIDKDTWDGLAKTNANINRQRRTMLIIKIHAYVRSHKRCKKNV